MKTSSYSWHCLCSPSLCQSSYSFWGETALHVVHAINRTPSPVIQNQTPYECLFGSSPDYHHLHSFSSACFILLQPHEQNKLEPRSRLCCFLGYGETQKGYRCYDLVSYRLRISHNVIFWEHRSFVELSHFRASLSSSFVLDPRWGIYSFCNCFGSFCSYSWFFCRLLCPTIRYPWFFS